MRFWRLLRFRYHFWLHLRRCDPRSLLYSPSYHLMAHAENVPHWIREGIRKALRDG